MSTVRPRIYICCIVWGLEIIKGGWKIKIQKITVKKIQKFKNSKKFLKITVKFFLKNNRQNFFKNLRSNFFQKITFNIFSKIEFTCASFSSSLPFKCLTNLPSNLQSYPIKRAFSMRNFHSFFPYHIMHILEVFIDE